MARAELAKINIDRNRELWEQKAISSFLLDNPSLQSALPPQESVSEAVILASQDFRLTTSQQTKLREMLAKQPT